MCGIDKSIRPSYIMESIMFFVSKILPHINYTPATSIADSSISNKEYIVAYANHPFTKLTGYPLCTVRELYDNSVLMTKIAHLINCPTLIFHGDTDIITPLTGTVDVFHKINNEKKLIIIKNKGHSLLVPKDSNDNEPQTILDTILHWFDLNTQ
jgi:alpha-beta hydrolase superfamily lysophospholipase